MAVYRNEVPLNFDRGALSRGVNIGSQLGGSFVQGQERRQQRGDELAAREELDLAFGESGALSDFEQEAAAAKDLSSIYEGEKNHIKARQQGAQILGNLKSLSQQSPNIRKANAEVVFAQFEKEFGRPLAPNVKSILLRGKPEEITPMMNEIVMQYANSESTSKNVVGMLTDPIASSKALGELNRSTQTQEGAIPSMTKREDPRKMRINQLRAREKKLTLVGTKYANTKTGQQAIQAANKVRDEISTLEDQIKGANSGPFETFVMPDGTNREVRRDSEEATMISNIPGVRRKGEMGSKSTFSDMKMAVIQRLSANQYPSTPEGKAAKKRDMDMYDLITNADPIQKLMREMMNNRGRPNESDPAGLR